MSNTITPTVFYRTLNVEGLEIFYREAGPRDAPTVLLLQQTACRHSASVGVDKSYVVDGLYSSEQT